MTNWRCRTGCRTCADLPTTEHDTLLTLLFPDCSTRARCCAPGATASW